MRRAVVCGANGFIGRKLVSHLRAQGVSVTCIGREKVGHDNADVAQTRSLAFGPAPWRAEQWVDALVEAKPDAVFHLAGVARGADAELAAVNVGLAQSLFSALRTTTIRPTLVLSGSAAEYGLAATDGVAISEDLECAPVSPYGRTKFAQTKAALAFAHETGTRVIIARIFNAVGPGMPRYLALADFAAQIAALRPPHPKLVTGDLDVSRDFIDVSHVAGALTLLANEPDARGPVNVCSGVASPLRPLVERMIRKSGVEAQIEFDPSRARQNEKRVIIGSTARMADLGVPVLHTDMDAIVDALVDEAQARAMSEPRRVS